MSFAPASRRGAFLKARLAVNGIQCAARSFGTLTVLALGLLSSMRASFGVFRGRGDCLTSYQFHRKKGTSITCDIPDISYGFLRPQPLSNNRARESKVRDLAEVCCPEPEHLALRILGV